VFALARFEKRPYENMHSVGANLVFAPARFSINCYKIIWHFVYLASVVRRTANNQGFSAN
jgi:hypothetical protein